MGTRERDLYPKWVTGSRESNRQSSILSGGLDMELVGNQTGQRKPYNGRKHYNYAFAGGGARSFV